MESRDGDEQDDGARPVHPRSGDRDDRQRRAAFEQERQVSEVPGKWHLEQLPGFEVRHGVHPAALTTVVQGLPAQPDGQRDTEQCEEHAAIAGAPRLERAQKVRLALGTASQLRLEEEPEKKPRERKRDARNREHQRKRAREGGEQRPRDTWRWRRDAGTRIRQRRGERESVPRRWKDRRVAHRAERGAAHSRPRHADVPPIVQPEIEELEQIPKEHARRRAPDELSRTRERRPAMPHADRAGEREQDTPPADGEPSEIDCLEAP